MLKSLRKLTQRYPRIKQVKFIMQGLVTYIPFKIPFLPKHRNQFTADSVREKNDYKSSAMACYINWLRLIIAVKSLPYSSIGSVAEIGPGDCLGVGLAALLSGSTKYYPIDKFTRSRNCDNLLILDELIKLFQSRAGIPNGIPRLEPHDFPDFITEDILKKSLAPNRVSSIRRVIELIQGGATKATDGEITIEYPSANKPVVDFIFSVAVMEHVDDPEDSYRRDSQYLREGGGFAHVIDFKSHGTAWRWNGHWTYSTLIWKLISGRTKYLINRWPHSWHINSLLATGFKIDNDQVYRDDNKLARQDLSKQFFNIPNDDLTIESVCVSGHK